VGATVAPKALPRFGVMADAGVPDGANASLVVRPFAWVRAHGGGGTNMIWTGHVTAHVSGTIKHKY
jgi:hypothetical protein